MLTDISKPHRSKNNGKLDTLVSFRSITLIKSDNKMYLINPEYKVRSNLYIPWKDIMLPVINKTMRGKMASVVKNVRFLIVSSFLKKCKKSEQYTLIFMHVNQLIFRVKKKEHAGHKIFYLRQYF